MCTADDTLIPVHRVDHEQLRKCRDWGNLTAWATGLDRRFCPGFDGSEGPDLFEV
jgi:hypothetical protein